MERRRLISRSRITEALGNTLASERIADDLGAAVGAGELGILLSDGTYIERWWPASDDIGRPGQVRLLAFTVADDARKGIMPTSAAIGEAVIFEAATWRQLQRAAVVDSV